MQMAFAFSYWMLCSIKNVSKDLKLYDWFNAVAFSTRTWRDRIDYYKKIENKISTKKTTENKQKNDSLTQQNQF